MGGGTKMMTFTRYAVIYGLSILFILMLSCENHQSDPQELIQAESLMEQRPDSALILLKQIKATDKLSTRQYAIYCLLLTLAQDKNYIPHTSDSLINIALNYFEKHNNPDRLIQTYYCMGRVYSDLQEALQAQKCYLKALELGKNLKDTSLFIKIYNSLGTLYSYQNIYEMALPMYKNAQELLKLGNDSTNISFALRNIGRTFKQTQTIDSAIYYYQQAITYTTPTSMPSLFNDLGNLYSTNNQDEEALRFLNKARELTTNKGTLYSTYQSLGELLIKKEQLDSAEFYLKKSAQSDLIYTKAGSYYQLAKIENKRQNYKASIRYVEQYEHLRDSIRQHDHFENIRVAQSMFNYQRIAEDNARFEREADQRSLTTYRVIIFFVAILLFCFWFFKREQNKKKQLIELKERLYKQSQRYIEDNKSQIRQLEDDLSSGKEEISEVQKQLFEARRLMLEMENRKVIMEQGTIHLLEKDFQKSSIYLKAHSEDCLFKSDDWSELCQLIDATYAGFTQRLIKLYSRISVEEKHICYLVKMQIPVKKIAMIMNITPSGVSQCRRRLYKKLTDEDGSAEKLDTFLSDF